MTLYNKRILVNGCSFSRAPESWTSILRSKYTTSKFTNLALPGAGNTYIHHSTISELAKNHYDMVIIMWSGPNRHDTLVGQPQQLASHLYVSGPLANKCVDGNHMDDLAAIEPNWVFQHPQMFKEVISYSSFETQYYSTLMHMISLQSFLKLKKIPYVYSIFTNYLADLRCHRHLYDQLDLSNFCLEDNIYDIAQRLKSYGSDDSHPGVEANKQWSCILENFIHKNVDTK